MIDRALAEARRVDEQGGQAPGPRPDRRPLARARRPRPGDSGHPRGPGDLGHVAAGPLFLQHRRVRRRAGRDRPRHRTGDLRAQRGGRMPARPTPRRSSATWERPPSGSRRSTRPRPSGWSPPSCRTSGTALAGVRAADLPEMARADLPRAGSSSRRSTNPQARRPTRTRAPARTDWASWPPSWRRPTRPRRRKLLDEAFARLRVVASERGRQGDLSARLLRDGRALAAGRAARARPPRGATLAGRGLPRAAYRAAGHECVRAADDPGDARLALRPLDGRRHHLHRPWNVCRSCSPIRSRISFTSTRPPSRPSPLMTREPSSRCFGPARLGA